MVSTSLLGTFLLLRQMAMIGDAISHAVLPGIALAFLWSGTRNPLWMLLGAATLGLVLTYMIQFLKERIKLQSDAAIGLSFTALFALGVLLITRYASEVDLDQACVLYGEIAYVPMDLWINAQGVSLGPRSLYIMGTTTVGVLLFVCLCYKQLCITSFDPRHAYSLGISVQRWHYALMSAVSFVVVAAFEVVGAILVVAFLVAPAAAAYLLTRRLSQLLVLSTLLGIVSVFGGYYLSTMTEGSIAAGMATCSGIVFGICFLIRKFFSSSKDSERMDTEKLKKAALHVNM